jgi:hypothetical protein
LSSTTICDSSREKNDISSSIMAEETGVKDAALSLFALNRGGSSTSSNEE